MKPQKKGVIALILVAFITACMGIFARYLGTELLLFQQVYLRIVVGLVLCLAIFWKDIDFSKFKQITPKEWFLLAFRGAASYLLGVTLFTQAIQLAKFSNVSFISALPFVALFGIIFLKEKLTLKKFLLLLMAFIGILLVAVKNYTNIFSWGQGEVLMLISTAFFAFSFIARRWHSKLLNNKEITIIMFFFASIFVFISSLFAGETLPNAGQFTPIILLMLFLAGLFNVFYLLFSNYGFSKVDALLSNNILTLDIVFSIIIGFFFFKELSSAKELIGGLIIVTSVIGMNNVETEKNKK